MVTFNDKDSSLSAHNHLTASALARRSIAGILPDASDLPVRANYLEQLNDAGAQVLYPLRWFNAAVVQADTATMSLVRDFSFVQNIQALKGPTTGAWQARTSRTLKSDSGTLSGAFASSLHLLGINTMQQNNITGKGVKVAVFDSGFDGVNLIPAFSSLQVGDTYDFVRCSTGVYGFDSHGTSVLSVMAAADSFVAYGGAPEAAYYLYRTEDVQSEWPLEMANWAAAAERADSLGVQIINSSLSYTDFDAPEYDFEWKDLNGKTSIISRAAAMAATKGILVVSSAGNYGNKTWRYVGMPADAEGILAVGAVTGAGEYVSLSSVGPTADNRLKPEVVAPGSGVPVLNAAGQVRNTSGTSFSSPAVAALAAGLFQAFPNEPARRIREAIIHSSTRSTQPDYEYGYGIPDYRLAYNFLKGISEYIIVDEPVLYPNPATNAQAIYVKIPNRFKNKGSITWEIRDPTGRKILTGKNDGDDVMTIPVSDKPPGRGTFYFRLTAGNQHSVWPWIWL